MNSKSAGSRHNAVGMEGRLLPCRKTGVDGATVLSHCFLREHLSVDKTEDALGFCLKDNHLHSTFTGL